MPQKNSCHVFAFYLHLLCTEYMSENGILLVDKNVEMILDYMIYGNVEKCMTSMYQVNVFILNYCVKPKRVYFKISVKIGKPPSDKAEKLKVM